MASASGSDSVPQSQCKNLLVAAIDFGTTYSCYAFSSKYDFNEDPSKIFASQWTSGTRALGSMMTPSCILLNEKKEFVAFGYEAEDMYGDLVIDEEHEKYFYFRRLKMLLHSEAQASGLKRDIMLEDDFKKRIRAMTIFTMSIKYLMDHLLKGLERSGIDVEDITWVLTVPAIWNDAAKQFMREAAIAAGIKSEYLIIALEPEAAPVHCMWVPMDKLTKFNTDKKGRNPSFVFPNGTKYLVLNAWGGAVDITIHEVVNQNTLKELHSASVGACGGVIVDEAFKQMIISIIGEDVFEKLVKTHPVDYEIMLSEFETRMKSVKSDKTTKETLTLPVKLRELYKMMKKRQLLEAVKECKSLKGKVNVVTYKLKVDPEVFKDLFDEPINNIVKHVKALLIENSSAGTSTIVLVGGFAEVPILQEAIKTNFPNQRLIIPAEAGLAVVKGAVLFGHCPLTIASRIAKCSYGVRVYRDFQAGVDPSNKKTTVSGRVKCKDVFAVHVKKGQELKLNEPQSRQRYTPLEADQLSLVFDIYTSTEENPMYVTDHSCSYLGQLEVEVPNMFDSKEKGVFINMIFGGTEIIVEAREERDQTKMTEAKFDFLQ